MLNRIYLFFAIVLFSCKNDATKIKPTQQDITESIYASGVVKSENQYQVFSTVNGIIDELYVEEGDSVSVGSPILHISNDAQELSKENARLQAEYAKENNNKDKLKDASMRISLAKNKLYNDSLNYVRQKNLWTKQIGTQLELEQRQLAFENSKTAYESALIQYDELKRQLNLAAKQSNNNLLISSKLKDDYVIKSKINGRIYSLTKIKGEMVNPQTFIGIIGDANKFVLEMNVDEQDILRVRTGQQVVISMDAYKDQTFDASITKINPVMNERTKSFVIEAKFINPPPVLFPNITFEGNILLSTKKNALLIPLSYLVNDSTVLNSDNKEIRVVTGLKDYQKVEILSGLSLNDELIKPTE